MEIIRNANSKSADHLWAAAERFTLSGRVASIRAYGSGNVHDTFLVALEGGAESHFILQRLNAHVFRQPELVMRNMRTVTEHLLGRLHSTPLHGGRRWEVPRVLLTEDAQDLWLDQGGSWWRALSFIGGAQPFDTVQNPDHAHEVGFALGLFHSLISDLPAEGLADTLEGFHMTPRYLRHYDEVMAQRSPRLSSEMAYALEFVSGRRSFAGVLETARMRGRLMLRPIHGDPKVNNIMIDTISRQAVSIIDLDTVKPGLIHYDLGDCLRSCCNLLGEETEQWETVRFEPDLGRVILLGYLERARTFLTGYDYEYLYDAIRLIAFELGLRFLTDHLEGNVYFKARRDDHNLARALVQFKLTASIEAQEESLRAMIRDLR